MEEVVAQVSRANSQQKWKNQLVRQCVTNKTSRKQNLVVKRVKEKTAMFKIDDAPIVTLRVLT